MSKAAFTGADIHARLWKAIKAALHDCCAAQLVDTTRLPMQNLMAEIDSVCLLFDSPPHQPDELDRLRAENEALRKDGERLDWWFSPEPKHAVFLSTYMTGVEHKWAPAKWRAEIDIAMSESDQKEQGE